MIVKMYAVLDSASGIYDGPVPAHTDGVAMRNFTNLAENPDSKIGMNPEHFSLWYVGSWNDATGNVIPAEPIVCLAKAVDVIGPKEMEIN